MKAKVNGGNQEIIYNILMNWENQRIAGWRLCQEMENAQTGITHVEVNTTNVKEERNKKKDVQDACHGENRRQFSRTSKTPLMHGQIS